MTDSSLAAAVADAAGVPQATATAVLKGLTAVLTDAAHRGEKVRLSGLFTLEVVDRAERTGRNPRTGEPLVVPAHRAVRVQPAASLKKAAQAGS